MWALLGMKRALALRSRWEASDLGREAAKHVAVLVARHDVYWRRPMPAVSTVDGVRLWLPFDCALSYCRDGSNASTCDLGNRIRNASAPPPKWILLKHSKSAHFGHRCDAGRDSLPPVCDTSVLIDWWFVADRAIADGFGATYDAFAAYSQRVQRELHLAISAPHQIWGLHFFRILGLRARCEVGHVLMHALDFTLGRFIRAGVDARASCHWSEWRPQWQHDKSAASCDASAIAGYRTMCPEPPQAPISYACDDA